MIDYHCVLLINTLARKWQPPLPDVAAGMAWDPAQSLATRPQGGRGARGDRGQWNSQPAVTDGGFLSIRGFRECSTNQYPLPYANVETLDVNFTNGATF